MGFELTNRQNGSMGRNLIDIQDVIFVGYSLFISIDGASVDMKIKKGRQLKIDGPTIPGC